MSRVDEIINKAKRKRFDAGSLIGLVESVLAAPVSLSEDAGEASSTDEVCLLIPDFRIDPSWMSVDEGNYDTERTKLAKAIEAVRLPREITNLEGFITGINGILSERNVDVSDHAAAISRIQLLRIFYNLATAPDETISGFLFESLMAIVFWGVRIPTDDRDNGVVDVAFPGVPVSLKFIKSKRTNIKGSLDKLQLALRTYPAGIKYIIADKQGDAIEFYEFDVDNDQDSPNYWGLLPTYKTQFSVSLKKLRTEREVRKLTTLRFSGIERKTQKILDALNAKFENLLSTLNDLNLQVTDLLYVTTEPKKTKRLAGKTARKAQKTKKSAEKVQNK